jgi:hypothetical protein
MCLLFLKIDMAVETDVIVFSVSSHTKNAQLWVFDDPEHLPQLMALTVDIDSGLQKQRFSKRHIQVDLNRCDSDHDYDMFEWCPEFDDIMDEVTDDIFLTFQRKYS